MLNTTWLGVRSVEQDNSPWVYKAFQRQWELNVNERKPQAAPAPPPLTLFNEGFTTKWSSSAHRTRVSDTGTSRSQIHSSGTQLSAAELMLLHKKAHPNQLYSEKCLEYVLQSFLGSTELHSLCTAAQRRSAADLPLSLGMHQHWNYAGKQPLCNSFLWRDTGFHTAAK